MKPIPLETALRTAKEAARVSVMVSVSDCRMIVTDAHRVFKISAWVPPKSPGIMPWSPMRPEDGRPLYVVYSCGTYHQLTPNQTNRVLEGTL